MVKAVRINHIDVAKGLGIIIVVYGHAAAQMLGTHFYNNHLKIPNYIIFSFVMPMFFMISGAFHRRRIETPNFNDKVYLKKIVTSLLLPFFSLSLVFLLINMLFSKFTTAPALVEMVIGIFLQQSNANYLPSGVLWFLFVLFSFNMITYTFINLMKLSVFYVILFSVLLRTDLNVFQQSYYFAFNTISKFYIYYISGYSLYNIILDGELFTLKRTIIAFAFYSFLLIIFSNRFLPSTFAAPLKHIISPFGICGILGSLFVLGFSYNISKYSTSMWDSCVKFVTYFGAYSILVYVFHMPTFTVIKKLSTLMEIEPGYTKQLMLFVPGIFFPLLYGKILSRKPFVYRLLIGGNPFLLGSRWIR